MRAAPYVFVLAGIIAISLFDVSRENEPLISEPRRGFPDEFARYFGEIKRAEGEATSQYEAGYQMAALIEMRAAAKNGPDPLPWVERGPGNVGGRTRAIIVDDNDPTHATWFAGSVGGGIWKTTDRGQNWVPLTDHLPRLSISALVQSPSNPDVMYAGTGEGYPNGDAAIGDGMFKTIDGGATWTPIPSTSRSAEFLFVNRIIIDPASENVVLAATNSGIHRSVDGGGSWTRVLDAVTGRGFYQVISEPGNFAIQYAADTGSGVWKSIDSGLSWTLSISGLAEAGTGARIELDISPVKPERLFALVEASGDGEIDPLYVSDNRAGLWVPFNDLNKIDPFDVAGIQGWYDLMVKAHPSDPDVVFLGGVALYRATMTGFTTERIFTGAVEVNTQSFLSFINFGGGHLGGGLRLGTNDDESTIALAEMVSVEIRFGPGISQFAHRFIPPDGPGINFADYPYANYIEVPFEAWDTENNRQLMVSFRDRSGDGQFNLIERDENNMGREYILIHARPYNASIPDPDIAQNGGAVNDLAYFLWPILASEAIWDPSNLPVSSLSFTWSDQGVPEGTITRIGADVHVDQHVMVATATDNNAFQLVLGNDGGIYYSGDGGSEWVGRFRGYNTSQFYGVDKKPGANAYIGGTQDNGSWRSFVNANSFQSWFSTIGGDGFDAVWHKQDERKLIASSQWNVFRRSLDGGAQWADATAGLTDTGSLCECAQFITVVAQSPDNSDVLFTIGESGVWKSSDFAGSWRLRAIPPEDWGFGGSGKVNVSLADANIVWAGYEMDAFPGDDDGKLQLSTDSGDSFSAVVTPSFSPGRISGLASSFDDASTVYVMFSASNWAKIIRSTDFGQTWEDLSGFNLGPDGLISQNGFPDVAVYDLLDFPGTPVLWAATEIGIIESQDNGLTWGVADNGLPAVSIWQLRLLDDQVVAATHGRGVWTLPLDAVPTNSEPAAAEIPEKLLLEDVYPNPFTTQTTIVWSAAESGKAHIRVFDMQGRLVATLLEQQVTAGKQETMWIPGALAAGAYFVQIEINGETLTRPVMHVR